MTLWEFVHAWVALMVLFMVSSFAWTIVHEFAHLIAAKLTCGVSKWDMKVLPCELDGVKVSGYVRYHPMRKETNKGRALISLAPFIVSTLVCVALPVFALTESVILFTIMSAGWIDHLKGSITESDPIWDLPSAAHSLKIPFWLIRICSLLIAVASAIASVYIFIDIGLK